MSKTKLEIIDETVEFYSNNPRSTRYKNEDGEKFPSQCCYINEKGNFCAHSRCLTDEAREMVKGQGRNGSGAQFVIQCYGDIIHKEEYQGHEPAFWIDVQKIHDTKENWRPLLGKDKSTLTISGKNLVLGLKNKWALL